MNVLLSVKPRFAKLIFDGTKRFEYRKIGFAKQDIQKVVVYASSPIKKIIGEFQISEIILDTPDLIWMMTGKHAGIDKEYFFQYFEGKKKACAIGILKAIRYKVPLDPRTLRSNFTPPQSFMYMEEGVQSHPTA